MDSGELLHIGADLDLDSSAPFPNQPAHQLSMITLDDQKAIEQISARVAKKHPSLGLQVIADAVEATYVQYEGCRIRDFVAVLVERQVIDQLRGR